MASVRIENEEAAVSEWDPECCCAMVALGPLFNLEDRLDLDSCAGLELGEAEGAAGVEAVAFPAEDFVQAGRCLWLSRGGRPERVLGSRSVMG